MSVTDQQLQLYFQARLEAFIKDRAEDYNGHDDASSYLEGIADSILYAWGENIIRCQSPIEKRLLAEVVFITNGYDFVSPDSGYQEAHGWPGFGTEFHCQGELLGYHPDFVFETYCNGYMRRLIVECDGHDFHERTKAQAARDRARDRKFILAGHRVLRFTGSEIHGDARACAGQIEAALADDADVVAHAAGAVPIRLASFGVSVERKKH